MSRLEQLIKELCPNGVKYKVLKDVCTFKQGTSITKKDIIDGDIPVVAGGQEPAYYCNKANRDGETIVISSSGAYAGYVSYWDKPIFVSDAFTVRPNNLLATKYVYYFLANKQSRIYSLQKGAGVPHVYSSDIAFLKIPLPPLPVQQEIVRILDSFANLTTGLETELKARRRQYEYYRSKLILFNSTERKVSLKHIAAYSSNRIKAALVNKNTYVGVDNLLPDKRGKTESSYVPNSGTLTKYLPGDILIGNIRPYLRKIWLATNTGGASGDVLTIRIKKESKEVISPQFLYHILSSEDFFIFNIRFSRGAKMPRGNKKAIMNYFVPIPPLDEQKRIVSILDKFDTLVNDTSIGIPAEIEARQKQYEYYRGKLLDFKEVK